MGTAILLVAMVGVFRFEATQAAGAAYDIAWEETTEAGTRTGGQTAEGDATSATVPLERRNVTRAEWVLEWTDDVGAPDTFNLTVTSPDGVTRSATGDAGKLSVVFDGLAIVPPEMRINARSEGDARDRQLAAYASDAAVGAWKVVVALDQAGDQAAPVGGVVLQQDAGNAWTLTPMLSAYEAVLVRR